METEMKNSGKFILLCAMLSTFTMTNPIFAQQNQKKQVNKISDVREERRKVMNIKVEATTQDAGKPIQKAKITSNDNIQTLLENRQSFRDFAEGDSLNARELAAILWCANGTNREGKGRTAPSALAMNLIDIYVFNKSGVYKWDPVSSTILPISSADMRIETGMQEFVQNAALNLVMVFDSKKIEKQKPDMELEKDKAAIYAAIEAGAISENIYLTCAALNLGTVVRGSFDNDKILNILQLMPENCSVICAQSIGRMPK